MTSLLTYVVRPISDRSAFTGPPLSGDRFPFRRSSWADTEHLLMYELERLDARRVVLELDVRDRDIRVDGTLRADARPSSPAVRLAFETDDGPMVFATDRYGWGYDDTPRAGGWLHNARAIALGLEALRKVDRYGITAHREQYRGFRALPAGGGVVASSMSTDVALEIVQAEAEIRFVNGVKPDALAGAVHDAKVAAHPDRNNGDRSRWDAVEQAIRVLERAGMLG